MGKLLELPLIQEKKEDLKEVRQLKEVKQPKENSCHNKNQKEYRFLLLYLSFDLEKAFESYRTIKYH